MTITVNILLRRLIDTNILYTLEQYQQLTIAAEVASSISMLSSFLIAIAFIYLRMSKPDTADRISLRCIFMASLMNLIYSAFDLGILFSHGDTVFCRASGIIYIFSQIMCAAFLTLVGINLVLVFVLNVHYSARQLKRFYYPGTLIFGLFTISVPVSQIIRNPFSDEAYQCYYFVFYYRVLGNTGLYWMWYYGCLIASVAVATICSAVALLKLVREHPRLMDKSIHIASSCQTDDTAISNIRQRLTYQSNLFVKVVSRCIAYPLIPLISNIWGFAFQFIILKSDVTPKFAFSMMDVIFKYLQGFFVALVFFGDPAMSDFLSERWVLCKEKYTVHDPYVIKIDIGPPEPACIRPRRLDSPKDSSTSSSVSHLEETSPASTVFEVTSGPYQSITDRRILVPFKHS